MKKVFILFHFFITLVIPFFIFSAGYFEAGLYQDNTGESLKYRIHLPDEYLDSPTDIPESAYPLLLFFHGSGQRGSDNFLQLAGSPQDILKITKRLDQPIIIVVPQCPAGFQWVDTPRDNPYHRMNSEPAVPMRLTIELFENIIKEYPVDSKRIYTVGFSMGGFAVWDILQRKPDLFAAAIPVSGGGDETLRKI